MARRCEEAWSGVLLYLYQRPTQVGYRSVGDGVEVFAAASARTASAGKSWTGAPELQNRQLRRRIVCNVPAGQTEAMSQVLSGILVELHAARQASVQVHHKYTYTRGRSSRQCAHPLPPLAKPYQAP